MDNTLLDLSGVTSVAVNVLGTVVLAVAARYLPLAMAAIDRHLDIKETAQQGELLNSVIKVGIGAIETKLDQKAMQVAHINIGNPAVLAEAQAVIATVPQAAAAMGMTPDTIAKAIVAGVDTLSRTTPTPVPPVTVQPIVAVVKADMPAVNA